MQSVTTVFYIIFLFYLYHTISYKYIIIINLKTSMHKFTFLDNTANFVLNSAFVETHHPSPWLSNTLFERLFIPEKVTNYKTSTVVSYKHEFLMVVA